MKVTRTWRRSSLREAAQQSLQLVRASTSCCLISRRRSSCRQSVQLAFTALSMVMRSKIPTASQKQASYLFASLSRSAITMKQLLPTPTNNPHRIQNATFFCQPREDSLSFTCRSSSPFLVKRLKTLQSWSLAIETIKLSFCLVLRFKQSIRARCFSYCFSQLSAPLPLL